MESINKKKYFFVLSKLLTALFILAGFFVGVSITKAETDHVVISEIQIAGITADDEFIELYNPTTQEKNLTGYNFKKRTKSGIGENVFVADSRLKEITIKAHGYLLLARQKYYQGLIAPAVWWPESYYLSSDNTIVLYDDHGAVVDKVGWGKAADFEGTAFPENPPAGQSLERKAWKNNACISAQGDNELLGNGCDTDNLEDFEIRTIPNPQNSQSAAETTLENSQIPDLTPLQTPTPAPMPASQPNSPSAEAGSDKIAVAGETVDFDGSDSFDPQGKGLTFNWNFGDGQSGQGENAQHAYNSAGEYTVVLRATNSATFGEDTLKVKISEPEYSDKIILSEILPDPKGLDKDGEWIELANTGDKKVNIRGWILDDKVGSGSKPYAFKDDIFIEPQGFLVVKRQESGLILPNKGGELNLLWYGGKNLSEVSYGAAKEGQSYALVNGAWQWTANITPEEKNILSQPVSKTANKTSGAKTVAGDGKQNSALVAGIASIASEEEESAIESGSANAAVVAGRASEVADSQEEILLPVEKENSALENNKFEINSKSLTAGELGGISGFENSEKLPQKNNNETKNNPWFWGDMALSALSLFLVWRYQELKKRIK